MGPREFVSRVKRMATVSNREATSAMAKVLGGCAAVGTFFSIIDTVRNPSLGNFTSVCIFGFASWALLRSAVLVKQPSFASVAGAEPWDTVVGRSFGAPAWVRPAIWVALFLVMISLFAGLYRYHSALQFSAGAVPPAFMAIFALYLFSCRELECVARGYLRRWYPDQPQVAIGADSLWITGTEVPWSCIRSISRRTRRLKVIGVDTIVVGAQTVKRPESIEIDLSDSVEDPHALYAKLRSAADAHGANLLPEGQEWGASSNNLRASRERVRAARQKYDEWRTSLPQEIAKTEAQLEDANSRIAESETRVRELEAALASASGQREQTEKRLEQARTSLRTRLALRDSLAKLLATQRNAWEKRR
jgi:hypothetical protein